MAVVALGGYGRRELCPFSDIDLMLLYRPEESERMQQMAEHLFYPLWDAGLELGHGARTIAESLRVAAENLELETSLLQARFLVGDQELFQESQERLRLQVLADGGAGFVARLLDARATRRSANGPASALLEPDLKDGEGGLRDVHELLWLAVALQGGGGLDGVRAAGWLGPTLWRSSMRRWRCCCGRGTRSTTPRAARSIDCTSTTRRTWRTPPSGRPRAGGPTSAPPAGAGPRRPARRRRWRCTG